MSLVRYDSKLELEPFGFDNMGATCYFNAVLQSLLSCTSFISELLKNDYSKNPVTRELTNLVKTAIDSQSSGISSMSPKIWREMVRVLRKTTNIARFNGQQCAAEGLHRLLESFDEFNELQNLFFHRYKSMVYCFECKKVVSTIDAINNTFEVEPTLQSEQLEKFKNLETKKNMNQYLSNNTGYVEDFKCPGCKNSDEKYKVNQLTMVPEILAVLSKKYNKETKLDIYTEFPKTLEFNGTDGLLKYEAVSQIEHSGNLTGGHYWAVSKRRDGWYTLNDNSVSKSEFNPTKNTYIVFYHLV